ncbi:hypothetical protein SELMODRAFT_422026 [Selaginella moellendorffii]|uniref:Cyanovirin-N domain-containing protein n=1 Tax=Selaginella moellendorffii TaxID=88036 RepID=D8SH40_SELML|nr:hypothetical protein SELMODRAFT_422026 [Selaginella moellendorffii]
MAVATAILAHRADACAGFINSCEIFDYEDGVLYAKCKDEKGNPAWPNIDLKKFVGTRNGEIGTGPGFTNFLDGCFGYGLNYKGVLRGTCNGRGNAFDLNNYISNENGQLNLC